MADSLRILWGAEQPTRPTGYGVVTRNIVKRLAERGHEVFVMGWDYNGEDFKHEEGWTMVHAGISGFGGERTGPHDHSPSFLDLNIMRLQPDAYVSLIDPWFLGHAVHSTNMRDIPYFAYLPVDGYPISREWMDILKLVHTPVWMSEFGRQQFKEYVDMFKSEGSADFALRDPVIDRYEGLETPMVYHGVDHQNFVPLSDEQKREARERLGIGRFDTVFLSVGRNQNRKQIPRLLEAFSMMLEKHPSPSTVGLVLHCGDPQDSYGMGGWNLPFLIKMMGLADNVTFSDPSQNPLHGLSSDDMALLYGMADVHVLATGGEGFGIPSAEAMSCGLPVILPDNSTGPELVGATEPGIGERGILVESVAHIIGPKYGVSMTLVDIPKLADAMLTLATDENLRKRLGGAGREHAVKEFCWEKITDQFEQMFLDAKGKPHPLGNNAKVMR
tara:strand:- start:32364 stop:33695 length:1332 start_codon:yes stop_codon:yes gene_type:complete